MEKKINDKLPKLKDHIKSSGKNIIILDDGTAI